MKRKVKSLKQLLEEFPCAQFDTNGDLVFPEVRYGHLKILSKFLWRLGGAIESEEYFRDTWPEEFLEPLPEKKTIFYEAFKRSDGQLVYFDCGSDGHANALQKRLSYERVPELDIVKEVE